MADMIGQRSPLNMLKGLVKSVPFAREVKRTSYQTLNASHLRVLNALPAFKPNIGESGTLTLRGRADLTLQTAQQVFPLLVSLLEASGHVVAEAMDVGEFVTSDGGRNAADRLKSLFDQYGSDKARFHNYHLAYGQILADIGRVESLLEIGLGTNNEDVPSNMGQDGRPGASLRAFRDYLQTAQIYGADVDRRVLFSEERIKTFFVDQTDPRSVEALGGDISGRLQLVIDDGLHSPNANLAVLQLALRKLQPGGWVVIEDIAWAARPIWQVVDALMPSDFQCRLLATNHALMFVARRNDVRPEGFGGSAGDG